MFGCLVSERFARPLAEAAPVFRLGALSPGGVCCRFCLFVGGESDLVTEHAKIQRHFPGAILHRGLATGMSGLGPRHN